MSKQTVTESMHPEKKWFEEAKEQTVETLPTFINHIMNDYNHDYGTVCHAVAACALAAMVAANNTPSGGITSFQAGFVMWDFVRQTCFTGNECGMKILDYDDMLYPQYEYKYQKTIREDVWKSLQQKAKTKLETTPAAHPAVKAHWESIISGKIPFGYTIEEE